MVSIDLTLAGSERRVNLNSLVRWRGVEIPWSWLSEYCCGLLAGHSSEATVVLEEQPLQLFINEMLSVMSAQRHAPQEIVGPSPHTWVIEQDETKQRSKVDKVKVTTQLLEPVSVSSFAPWRVDPSGGLIPELGVGAYVLVQLLCRKMILPFGQQP